MYETEYFFSHSFIQFGFV